MKYLVTGGSGSGKSTWAEKLIKSMPETVRCYIATMKVYDDESRKRVARHRLQRAELGMQTIEREKDVGGLEVDGNCAVLLEDVPNLLANEQFDGGDPDRIVSGIRRLAEAARDIVIVTNEVCSDGITYADETEDYIKRLSAINRQLAATCDCVVEVVYSIPVCLKGELKCI